MCKKIFVQDLKGYLNQEVTELFFLRKITNETNGKVKFRVTLVDSTGEVSGMVWEEDYLPEYLGMEDNVVRATFKVGMYGGNLSPTITKLELVRKFSVNDFVPSVPDVEGQYSSFVDMYKADIVNKPHMRQLVDLFYQDEVIKKRLKILQAGKMVHHVRIGGYMEHVISVYQSCKDFASRRKECIDMEVLLTAVALHDIGKVREFQPLPYNQLTDEGRLIGHLNLSLMMVYCAIKSIRDDGGEFPREDENKLLHLIATSHGAAQPSGMTGTEVIRPSCLEAVILSRMDDADSRVDSFEGIICSDTQPGNFTKYSSLYNQYIYKG